MNIVFYAVPGPVAQSIAEQYGFDLYRSAEEFESSILAAAANANSAAAANANANANTATAPAPVTAAGAATAPAPVTAAGAATAPAPAAAAAAATSDATASATVTATTTASATASAPAAAPSDAPRPAASEPSSAVEESLLPVAADVADGQLVIPADEAGVTGEAGEAAVTPDASALGMAAGGPVSDGAAGRLLLLPRLDSEERQSEFVEWMARFSNRVDAVISGQSSTISTVYYASQPGKFFSVERRHSDDDCEDLTYELSRILDSLLGRGVAHEEI